MRCVVRSLIGLAMLVAVGLGGIEIATKYIPAFAPGGDQQMQAGLIEPTLSAAPSGAALPFPPVPAPTFGGLVQTVAANEPAPLPPVTVAPQAPRAAPIDPIVTPLKAKPKASANTTSPKSPVPGKAAKSTAAKSTVARTAANKPASNKAVAAKVKSAKAKMTKSSSTAKLPANATGVTVTRPGFKLTCTAAQKLDPVNQRCMPLKTANAKKAKG